MDHGTARTGRGLKSSKQFDDKGLRLKECFCPQSVHQFRACQKKQDLLEFVICNVLPVCANQGFPWIHSMSWRIFPMPVQKWMSLDTAPHFKKSNAVTNLLWEKGVSMVETRRVFDSIIKECDEMPFALHWALMLSKTRILNLQLTTQKTESLFQDQRKKQLMHCLPMQIRSQISILSCSWLETEEWWGDRGMRGLLPRGPHGLMPCGRVMCDVVCGLAMIWECRIKTSSQSSGESASRSDSD